VYLSDTHLIDTLLISRVLFFEEIFALIVVISRTLTILHLRKYPRVNFLRLLKRDSANRSIPVRH